MKKFLTNVVRNLTKFGRLFTPWKTIRQLRTELRVSETMRYRLQEAADNTAKELLSEAQRLRGKIYALTAALSRHEIDQQAKAAKKPRKRAKKAP